MPFVFCVCVLDCLGVWIQSVQNVLHFGWLTHTHTPTHTKPIFIIFVLYLMYLFYARLRSTQRQRIKQFNAYFLVAWFTQICFIFIFGIFLFLSVSSLRRMKACAFFVTFHPRVCIPANLANQWVWQCISCGRITLFCFCSSLGIHTYVLCYYKSFKHLDSLFRISSTHFFFTLHFSVCPLDFHFSFAHWQQKVISPERIGIVCVCVCFAK